MNAVSVTARAVRFPRAYRLKKCYTTSLGVDTTLLGVLRAVVLLFYKLMVSADDAYNIPLPTPGQLISELAGSDGVTGGGSLAGDR